MGLDKQKLGCFNCKIFDISEAPDSGDMLQAEKAGLMELADILLVNKSDLERANEKAEQLHLAFELSNNEVPPILLVSAKKIQVSRFIC